MIDLDRHPFASPSKADSVAITGAVAGVLVIGLLAARWPVVGLVAVAGAAAVAIALVRTELAILLLVASGPLEFSLNFGTKSTLFTPTKLAGAICFLSFALNVIVNRRKLVMDAAHGLVFGLLAIAMISTVRASSTTDALATTVRYASFVALFVVVSQYVRKEALFRRIVWVLSIAAGVTSAVALWQFFSGHMLSARTVTGDPNDIAFALATTLPLTFWLLEGRPAQRVLAFGLIGLISLATLLAFSRGALVGLAAGITWKILVERRHRGAILSGVIIAAVAIGVVLATDPGRVETGLKAKETVASENVVTRLDAWSKAARFSVDHPLLGIGPGNFKVHYASISGVPVGTETVAIVHNAYLDIAAELGVLALVLFISYLAVIFKYSTAAEAEGRGPPGLAGSVRTALIIGAFSALTLSEQYFAPFWLLGGLACAIRQTKPRRPDVAL
ncbi:MAG: O-antigen ligase family protein [Gaiellaceae bacterium]